MASENEGKRETLAAIAAEIRSYGDRPPPKCAWLDIADRIEAIDSADAWRSLYTPGNAAAMRDALNEIDRVVWDKRRHTKEETEAHRLATEALSKPARNCDVYKTSWDVVTHWDGGLDSTQSVVRMLDWLLAPAAERKGEGDGK